MEGDKKYKKTIYVLSTLLGVSIVALAGTEMYKQYVIKKPTSVILPAENIITSEEKSEEKSKIDNTTKQQENDSENNSIDNTQVNEQINNESNKSLNQESTEKILSLHKKQANDNDTFNLVNMFPGDTVIKNYCIKVSYKDSVTLRFGVDTHNGYEKLSEAMKIKVVLSTTGETLYDGYIKDMPTSLNHTLSFTDTSKSEELYYNVTAYLDTSVGNEYMGKDLKLNFKWWVEETDNLQKPPSAEDDMNVSTGDNTNIVMWLLAMVGSMLVLIYLYSKAKKEGKYYGE